MSIGLFCCQILAPDWYLSRPPTCRLHCICPAPAAACLDLQVWDCLASNPKRFTNPLYTTPTAELLHAAQPKRTTTLLPVCCSVAALTFWDDMWLASVKHREQSQVALLTAMAQQQADENKGAGPMGSDDTIRRR